MTFQDLQSAQRSPRLALLASGLLIVSSALSVLYINAFGAANGFGFVPLLMILVWPRRANGPISVAGVFLAGLLADWSTGGVVGQWALVYTICFALLRPELRNAPFVPLRAFFAWLAMAIIASALLFLSGRFLFGILPDLGAILRQFGVATLFLPLVLLLRHWASRATGVSDEWVR